MQVLPRAPGVGGARPAENTPGDPAPIELQDYVDPTVLGQLTARLGDSAAPFLVGLIDTFQTESDHRLADLDAAAANDDAVAVAPVAHTMKSSSAPVGALRFSEFCTQLEQDLRQAPTTNTTPSVAPLRDPSTRAGLDPAGLLCRR